MKAKKQIDSKANSTSNISLDGILNHAKKMLNKSLEFAEANGLLTLKTANDWIEQAKSRPIPKRLFGDLWFEGELCILFADTNLGKSSLAVQIADSISRNKSIPNFAFDARKQPTVYFDFELSDKQFENRYSKDFEDHYQFDKNFKRVEINSEAIIPEGIIFEEHLYNAIEKIIIETKAKILIIDNITYLSNQTDKAREALPLMKYLKKLKNKYGLSILVLAHTPKRDLSKVITRNDLQGSKMLINFCDSAFAIGESKLDKNIRYLKQIKARSTEIIYDSENVCICEIGKPHNFLKFMFVRFGNEKEHLKEHTEKDRSGLLEQIKELKKQGMSLRKIGSELGITHMRVKRILDDNS
ncbi:MAG: AAA family ATPase [Bacteroidota bacterium]|nr:AAA family ATPase [Bacteroidota bacterium]